MDNKTFMVEREAFHADLTKLFDIKREDYDLDEDRFGHFKRSAALDSCTPAEALISMATKHEISVHDMVKAMANGKTYTRKQWMAKIGDVRNYCDLLWGMLVAEGDI